MAPSRLLRSCSNRDTRLSFSSQNCNYLPGIMATRGTRTEKVKRIFRIFLQFDADNDGVLSRSEMAALVIAVNPRVKFTDDQLTAIIDEVFNQYAKFIDCDKGLTFDGFLRTYDDGAGDVDRDFEVLGLEAHERMSNQSNFGSTSTTKSEPESSSGGDPSKLNPTTMFRSKSPGVKRFLGTRV